MGVELNPTWRGVDLKALRVPALADRPRAAGRRLRPTRSTRAIGTLTPQMIALPGVLVAVPVHALPRRGRRAVDVRHHRREVRLHAGVGRPRAGALLLLHRRLVPASRRPSRCRRRRWCCSPPRSALGLWMFRGANKQKHTFKVDPRRRSGARRRGCSAAPARLRVVGPRPQDQLHRRAHRVLRDRRHRRPRPHRPVPGPAVAALAARAPRLARRAALQRQVRRRCGRSTAASCQGASCRRCAGCRWRSAARTCGRSKE
jgi:hypothetical protein